MLPSSLEISGIPALAVVIFSKGAQSALTDSVRQMASCSPTLTTTLLTFAPQFKCQLHPQEIRIQHPNPNHKTPGADGVLLPPFFHYECDMAFPLQGCLLCLPRNNTLICTALQTASFPYLSSQSPPHNLPKSSSLFLHSQPTVHHCQGERPCTPSSGPFHVEFNSSSPF